MLGRIIAGSALLAAFLAAPAGAQDEDALILFSKGRYKGARFSTSGAVQSVPAFTAKSVQVPSGTDWELCSGNRFSGCRRYSASIPAFVMTVRSVRPVGASAAAVSGASAVGAASAPVPGGPALRGMAAEFFVAPERNGSRIQARSGAAAESARDYCRSLGWKGAAHGDVQTANGTTYLADVLCVNSN